MMLTLDQLESSVTGKELVSFFFLHNNAQIENVSTSIRESAVK